jgi:hypothetical protein
MLRAPFARRVEHCSACAAALYTNQAVSDFDFKPSVCGVFHDSRIEMAYQDLWDLSISSKDAVSFFKSP